MKISSIIRYLILAIFNAIIFYAIPLSISFESWFLLSLIVVNAFLVNFVYLTNRFKPMKWILPGMIFMISFVVFPAFYNTYVSFTNWSTGHILNKSQAIQILEDRTYTPEDQKGVEFDLYILQDINLDFFYVADLEEGVYFGKAVYGDEIFDSEYARVEPSLFIEGNFQTPDGYYLLSGKEQIANSGTLQELSLVLNKNTRATLYKISVFGASTGRLSSTSQLYSYDSETDTMINNATNSICPAVVDNFECDGLEIDPGWRVNVGFENYTKLFSNQRIRGPLNIVAKWTFQFAVLTVLFSFFVGLLLSLILNKEGLKFQRIYRSLLYFHMLFLPSYLFWSGKVY